MRGRVVIVTGSAEGVGFAIASACAALGATVVLHDRNAARVEAAARAIDGDALGIAADLATPHGARSLVGGALEAHGRIDALVCAAGFTARAPLWQLEPHEVETLLGPTRCAREALAWAVPRAEPIRIVQLGDEPGLVREVQTTTAVVVTVAPGDSANTVHRVVDAITAPAERVHGRVLGEPATPALDVDAVDLLSNATTPSPRARAALVAAAAGPLERYPEPPATLRKLVAARFGVPLDAVVIGGGASELFERVLRVAARPGEALIANAPGWPVLPFACRARGIAFRAIAYVLGTGRADHDLDAILAAVDRSVRIVYLASPANPVGAAIDDTTFERWLEAMPRHVTIVVDEAYAEFTTRPAALRATRFVGWIDNPLVVLRTFSKFHALAGLRIGYAIATPDLACALAHAAPPFAIVRGAEDAAIAALSDAAHAARSLERFVAARDRLERSLDERSIPRLASDAPFVLAADPNRPGPRFFDRQYVMLPIPWMTDDTTIP